MQNELKIQGGYSTIRLNLGSSYVSPFSLSDNPHSSFIAANSSGDTANEATPDRLSQSSLLKARSIFTPAPQPL